MTAARGGGEVTRPPVSVVMPFAGDPVGARAAVEALRALDTAVAGDELILADNSGVVPEATGVTVVRADAEQSPAHARNVGAEHAGNDWILFLDADCIAPPGLLDAYFEAPIADDVGALAGEVVACADAPSVAARYGAARSFLSQSAHLRHPFRPRAVAANLLVRRVAFLAVGGFYEGVRAAEDTDFSWRLQAAGWRLELRAAAAVRHRYRTSVRELRRQWRGYAAGRAWLGRRYDGFVPEPAVWRGVRRAVASAGFAGSAASAGSGLAGGRVRRPSAARPSAAVGASSDGEVGPAGAVGSAARSADRSGRGRYLAIDVLLAGEELAGFLLSNRPGGRRRAPARVVLVADRFPARLDPLAELAVALEDARVEAVARPESPDLGFQRRLRIDYREDDGIAARVLSLISLALRHPVRCALDRARRPPDAPPLPALAPAVRRLERDAGARIQPLGAGEANAIARRLERLARGGPRRLPGLRRRPRGLGRR